MATIVNNPGGGDSGSGAAGWVVAAVVIIAVVLGALFVWPGMRGGGGTQVNVPDTIDVNIPAAGGGDAGGAQ